jgi:hypothetical protein
MTLGVLRRMKEKTDHVRRQSSASNRSGIQQRCLGGSTKLCKGSSDSLIERRDECRRSLRSATAIAFPDESGFLGRRQPFATRVRKETIEAAGGVLDMKAY